MVIQVLISVCIFFAVFSVCIKIYDYIHYFDEKKMTNDEFNMIMIISTATSTIPFWV